MQSCVSCEACKYKATVSLDACSDCAAGTYSSTVGSATSETCISCGAGTYSAATGQTSDASCITCPEHSQPDVSGSSCVCDAGYSLQNCQDDLSWSDVNNASCSTYLAKGWCGYGIYFNYTWETPPDFPLDTRDRDGIDDSEACCACGKADSNLYDFNPTLLSTVCTACSGDTFKETVGNSATEPGCTPKDCCCVCPAFSQTPGMVHANASECGEVCAFGKYMPVGSDTCTN